MSAALSLLLFVLVLPFAWAGLSFAPWVPTRSRDLDRIDRLAGLAAGEAFVELGSGDGRTLRTLSSRHPLAAFTGIEIVPQLWLWSWVLGRLRGGPNASYRLGDLYRTDLSGADVVFFFGMPEALRDKLAEKLARECRPGTRVLSYAFEIDGWRPETVDKPDETRLPLYRYRIGAHLADSAETATLPVS